MTITALVDVVYVPIFTGAYEIARVLLKGESFTISTELWSVQDIAQQLVTLGQISVS